MRTAMHWIVGTALALLGVALARLVAPSAGAARSAWQIGGNLLALVGIFTIAVGTRRKYRPAARSSGPDGPPRA